MTTQEDEVGSQRKGSSCSCKYSSNNTPARLAKKIPLPLFLAALLCVLVALAETLVVVVVKHIADRSHSGRPVCVCVCVTTRIALTTTKTTTSFTIVAGSMAASQLNGSRLDPMATRLGDASDRHRNEDKAHLI